MKFKKQKRPIDYLPSKPDKALWQVWSIESLDNVREQIDDWFYIALCSDGGIYDDPKEREMFILFYRQFEILIEATYFYNKSQDIERKKKYEESSEELQKIMDSINLPIKLTQEETLNTIPIIQTFCNTFSLVYIRVELWDWLDAVIWYKGYFKASKKYATLHYLNLLTLCEAAYVITTTKQKI